MRIRTFPCVFAVSALVLSAAGFAAPLQDVPPAPAGQPGAAMVMDELVVTGATEQGRTVQLEAAEQSRPAAARLPQVDEQAWLPQSEPAQ